ncbi:MAG: PAS domain S-box protein, partial [Bacteroidales bacterium]
MVKVLLVEDNESDGALIIRQLEKANYAVLFERVESNQEMKLALEQKDWDIIISDFSLPQFNAYDSLQVLHDSGKDIPFIVVSGTIGESTAVDMMKSGAQDYLMKDNLTRLAPAVGRELADARVRHERKHESLKLKESEAKFRAVWENSKDAIGVSLNGIHVFVNPAYLALFGYDNQDVLLGKSLVDLVGPSEKERIREYIERRNAEIEIPSEYETIGIKKDGTFFDLDVKVSNFDLNNEMHTIVILRDISERKKSDERLREELVNLTAAEKRAEESNLTKSFLMMNMSHEVRTPLNAILGFSSIISQESEEEDIRQMADRIRVSGERLLKTLDDILKLTQLQTGTEQLALEEVELESELQRMIANFKPLAELKNLQLKFQPKQKVKVKADPHLLNKAIGELLDNAIKFTDQGRVSIELNRVPVDNVPWIEIKVADTGIGISKEYHQVIFESF